MEIIIIPTKRAGKGFSSGWIGRQLYTLHKRANHSVVKPIHGVPRRKPKWQNTNGRHHKMNPRRLHIKPIGRTHHTGQRCKPQAPLQFAQFFFGIFISLLRQRSLLKTQCVCHIISFHMYSIKKYAKHRVLLVDEYQQKKGFGAG